MLVRSTFESMQLNSVFLKMEQMVRTRDGFLFRVMVFYYISPDALLWLSSIKYLMGCGIFVALIAWDVGGRDMVEERGQGLLEGPEMCFISFEFEFEFEFGGLTGEIWVLEMKSEWYIRNKSRF